MLIKVYIRLFSLNSPRGINMSISLMDPASWQSYVLTAHKEDALSARNQGYWVLILIFSVNSCDLRRDTRLTTYWLMTDDDQI